LSAHSTSEAMLVMTKAIGAMQRSNIRKIAARRL
jgi:hypothetical protein